MHSKGKSILETIRKWLTGISVIHRRKLNNPIRKNRKRNYFNVDEVVNESMEQYLHNRS